MKKGVRNRILIEETGVGETGAEKAEVTSQLLNSSNHNSFLKNHRSQDHIHPSVHNSAHVGVILVHRILQSPIFDVYHFFRYVFFNKEVKYRFAAHAGEPLVKVLSSDGVRVADQLNFVFVQQVRNRIKPMGKFNGLVLIHVVTAAVEVNTFADLVLLGGDLTACEN